MIWLKTIALIALLGLVEVKAYGKTQLEPTKLKNIQSKTTTLRPGKVTVVQFWASWCVSCGETMQKLNRISKKSKVKLVGVSLDEEVSAVKGYIKAKPFMKKFRKKILWDPEAKLAESLNVEAVPTIVVYSKSGKEVFRSEGKPEGSDLKAIRKAIRRAS